MKCSMCEHKAEVRVSWPASVPQDHAVCECCASQIWNKLSTQFTGTEAFRGFTILPINEGFLNA